jgi:hypothetical protein
LYRYTFLSNLQSSNFIYFGRKWFFACISTQLPYRVPKIFLKLVEVSTNCCNFEYTKQSVKAYGTSLFNNHSKPTNAASVISPTLASVKGQTFTDFEYLIIDGASHDDTLQLVAEAEIPNTHIQSEPDKGLYDAMNKSIKKAQGHYLIFLNAGDSFATRHSLADIAAKADDDPGIIYGQTQLVNSARQVVGPRHLTAPSHLTADSFKHGMLVCHQALHRTARHRAAIRQRHLPFLGRL